MIQAQVNQFYAVTPDWEIYPNFIVPFGWELCGTKDVCSTYHVEPRKQCYKSHMLPAFGTRNKDPCIRIGLEMFSTRYAYIQNTLYSDVFLQMFGFV